MQLAHKPTKLLITGCSGSGKSTYWTRYVLNCWHDKIFIFDHEAEYCFRNALEPCYEITEDIVKNNRYVIYDPSEQFPGATQSGFNYFAELVFEVAKTLPGTKLFATDELQKIVDVHTVTYELALLIETGRRYGVDTAFVTQQPNLIHNRLRNQLTELVTFRHLDERAIKFLMELGFDPETILLLQDLEFQSLDLRTLDLRRGKIQFDRCMRQGVDITHAQGYAPDTGVGSPVPAQTALAVERPAE